MSAAPQPAGNYYDKYRTANPIARHLMQGFLGAFDALAARVPVSAALEIGCGEGELSIRLAQRGFRVRGCDISAEIVEEARRRAQQAGVAGDVLAAADRVDQRARRGRAVRGLLRSARAPRRSRARRRHAGRTGAALAAGQRAARTAVARAQYGARQIPGRPRQYTGPPQPLEPRGFLALLARRFEIVEMRSPLPWTMALCKRR